MSRGRPALRLLAGGFPALRATGVVIVAVLSWGCGGAAAGGGAGVAAGDAAVPGPRGGDAGDQDDRWARRVYPFTVHDATGTPYDHPFLGGFDVPRPQLVDIDADGDLDLFVQERTDALIFLENVGTAAEPEYRWRSERWMDLQVGEWSRFADLDDDGDMDLMAEEPFSYVRYYENTGTSREPAWSLVADSVRTPDGEPVFADRQNIPNVADIDCNGQPDLFLGRIDGTVARWELAGWGTGGGPQFRLITERFEDIEIVAQIGGQPAGDADRDRDGPLDRDQEGARERPLDRDEEGTRDRLLPTLHGANAMGIADVDGDGDLDFLWGDFFEPSVLRIENTGGCPGFDLRSEPRPVPTVPGDSLLTSGYNVPVPVDLDDDGDLDLVVGVLGGAFNPARTASDNLHYWERLDDGRLELRTRRLLNGIDLGSESAPAAGDLDGDGDLDLLAGNRIGVRPGDASLVFHFENRGTATEPVYHLADTLVLGDAYHYAPLLWDLDGDGDLDLVMGTWNDDVLLFRNEGTPRSPEWVEADEPLVVLTRGSNATPALGDVDGDGLPDLFVGEASGDLNLYRNVGAAGAPEFELVSDDFQEIDAGRRSHPVLFDWDGDGDLDLLLGREEEGLLLYLNDGSATFTEAGVVLEELLPPYAAPVFADLDGDGDPDILSGALSGGLIYLENRGG